MNALILEILKNQSLEGLDANKGSISATPVSESV